MTEIASCMRIRANEISLDKGEIMCLPTCILDDDSL